MNRRMAALAVAMAAALLAAAIVVWWLSEPRGRETPGAAGEVEAPTIAAEPLVVELVFPGADGLLHGERQEIDTLDAGAEPEKRLQALLQALLVGPQSVDLLPPFAWDVKLGSAKILSDGTVFVDLASPELLRPPSTGSKQELLSLYSLVHTVVRNVDRAQRVVLLWNGRQPQTFGGHVDTSRPLVPDASLLANKS